jgi:hypothetical protein
VNGDADEVYFKQIRGIFGEGSERIATGYGWQIEKSISLVFRRTHLAKQQGALAK